MLDKLLEIGTAKGYFEHCLLCDIPKCQCHTPKVDVIDFDKTKEIVVRDLNELMSIDQFKSCDCLKVLPSINRIDFIEIKGLNEYIKRYSDKSLSPKEQVEKFNIASKYYDSNMVLGFLLQILMRDLTKPVVSKIKEIRPNFILLIDVPPEKKSISRFAITMRTLANGSSIKSELFGCLEAEFERNELQHIPKKLITESQIDHFYQELVMQS